MSDIGKILSNDQIQTPRHPNMSDMGKVLSNELIPCSYRAHTVLIPCSYRAHCYRYIGKMLSNEHIPMLSNEHIP